MTLQDLLRNPIYAGAYAYGRRQVDPRRQRPGRPHTGRRVIDPAEWLVLLPDRLPASITWDQYERNLARLRANQARGDVIGAVRSGPALLAGLVECARCEHRLTVRYGGRSTRPTSVCGRLSTEYGGELCQQMAGRALDQVVSRQVLAALEPAALELSLAAATQIEQERAELDQLWRQRLERAADEVARAERQYQLAEPEHRLVTRQLERAWEEQLAAQQQLDEADHRVAREQPRLLSPAEQATIRRLAAAIPAVWDAPTTTDADRKAIIRQLVERVTVAVQGESERVQVTITWAGGVQTAGDLVRPVARVEPLSYDPQLVERLHALAADGVSAATIAQRLNDEGVRPPKRRERFGPQGVQDLLHRLGSPPARRRSAPPADLGVHAWGLADLARAVGLPPVTLFTWIRRGWVTGRQEAQPPRRWSLWADEATLEQLRERHRRPPRSSTRRQGVEEPCASLAHRTDLTYPSVTGGGTVQSPPTGAEPRCPVCRADRPARRARCCSDACRQRAHRLRQVDLTVTDTAALVTELQRRAELLAHRLCACPACGEQDRGEPRCPDCTRFCRLLGLGGACPACDQPIRLAELLGRAPDH